MKATPRAYRDLDGFFEAMEPRLNRRAAYETVRNLAALYDAFVDVLRAHDLQRATCQADDVVMVTPWIVAGLNRELAAHLPEREAHRRDELDVLLDAFRDLIPRAIHGTGRLARWRRRYRADHIHFTRFEDVWFWRLRDPGWYYRGQKRTFGWNLLRKGASRVGHDDDRDVFEQVSAHLEQGPALYRGAPKTIAKSFEVVTRAIDAGEIGRFYPSTFVRVAGAFRSALEDCAY